MSDETETMDDGESAAHQSSRSSVSPEKVVSACQLRDEYVERLMEMVTSKHWGKMVSELSTILDVLKLSTVQLVEAVCEWRDKSVFPFVWNGENILLRIASDLDFLDDRKDISRWISLPSLHRNPFLQLHNLDDIAEKPLERREPLGIAAESFPMSARIQAASWVILDEERMHGRFEHDISKTIKEKLRSFQQNPKSRQFLRRSEWSTRKQFNRVLAAREIHLNAIEKEWLGRRVRFHSLSRYTHTYTHTHIITHTGTRRTRRSNIRTSGSSQDVEVSDLKIKITSSEITANNNKEKE